MAPSVPRDSAPDAADGGALVLYGQRSGEAPQRGCPNATKGLRLAVTDLGGPTYLQLRCKRRDCRYCGHLRNLEDATCLFLDALAEQPTLSITLTTAQPWEQLDPATYREASAQLWRALRARYGGVEYVGTIEFTTGLAPTSGGHRRMHGHYLVKGISEDQVLDVERLAVPIWKRVTGAYKLEVSALRSAGGAIAYMGLHHRKEEQAPPAGWRGMRLRASKGYWHVPIPALREQARRHLAIRSTKFVMERDGASPEWAEVAAPLRVDAQRQAVADHGVQLVKVREAPGGVVVPLGPLESDRPERNDGVWRGEWVTINDDGEIRWWRCARCARQLSEKDSRELGIGPECRDKPQADWVRSVALESDRRRLARELKAAGVTKPSELTGVTDDDADVRWATYLEATKGGDDHA
jgi:hypothetical protein